MITPSQVLPYPGINTQVKNAFSPVLVAGGDAVAGYIINPATTTDQGTETLQILYVDPTGPAAYNETDTTVAIQPGGRYNFPPNVGLGIWANSQASGHKFTAVQIFTYPFPLPPPAYTQGNFPPAGPTGVLSPIPSYLYQEYSDDQDLQAFVNAYNSMMQDIVDTFNGLNLPVYTGGVINGALLDWVANGIYGIYRQSLSTGKYSLLGPYNTEQYNTAVYNNYQLLYPQVIADTGDDLFKRIMTWHISKREGKNFNIEWLKRRIMKFLFGVNGTQPNIDNTYQISVTFGPNYNVTIRLIAGNRFLKDGAIYNFSNFTYNTYKYGQLDSYWVPLNPLPYVIQFNEAVQSGLLELPFQFNYTIVIG